MKVASKNVNTNVLELRKMKIILYILLCAAGLAVLVFAKVMAKGDEELITARLYVAIAIYVVMLGVILQVIPTVLLL